MSEDKPIIRIWDLEDSQYQVDVDTLKITKKDGYLLMKQLVEIYEGENKQ